MIFEEKNLQHHGSKNENSNCKRFKIPQTMTI